MMLRDNEIDFIKYLDLVAGILASDSIDGILTYCSLNMNDRSLNRYKKSALIKKQKEGFYTVVQMNEKEKEIQKRT